MSDVRIGRPVGRIAGLWRYPVKSMGGEALAEAQVGWHGMAGDRRWAFVRAGAVQSGFPWFTLRERADLSHYRPRFLEPARADASTTLVQTPSGATFDTRPRHYSTKSQDMIAGAVWRDPEHVDDWIGALSKTEPVITFCVYGFHIGCQTAATLRAAGFDARYMSGGHYAWKAIKGPVTLFE